MSEYKSYPIILARADGGIEVIDRGKGGGIFKRTMYTNLGELRSIYEYDGKGILAKVSDGIVSYTLYPNGEKKERYEGGKLVEDYNQDGTRRFSYKYNKSGLLEMRLYGDGSVAANYYANGKIRCIYDRQGRKVREYLNTGDLSGVWQYDGEGRKAYAYYYSCGMFYYRCEFDKDETPVCSRNKEGLPIAEYNGSGGIKTSYEYKHRNGSVSITSVIINHSGNTDANRMIVRGTGTDRKKGFVYDMAKNLLQEYDDMDKWLESMAKPFSLPRRIEEDAENESAF